MSTGEERAEGQLVRVRLRLAGRVQGLGLRGWCARRAQALGLAGSVRNAGGDVEVALEGARSAIDAFRRALDEAPPHGLRVDSIARADEAPQRAARFAIDASRDEPVRAMAPPDVPICADCLAELYDPRARRFAYAFTHCARCGPRSSILHAPPWDRARTTLAAFPLCAECQREHDDLADRRHHAQGIACPRCGPRLVAQRAGEPPLDGDPLGHALAVLHEGGVVALKGFGGWHLAVDATRAAAVARLRARKRRPARPFALLLPDLARARALVLLSAEDEALLAGELRPVLVAPRRAGACTAAGLAREIAPTTDDLGVLLPYAPLHHLLLRAPAGDGRPRPSALVLTSANRSGEPTLADDAEAARELAEIADLFVGHDRAIAHPSDDSVFRTHGRGAIAVRLSRAAAPRALRVASAHAGEASVLAIGADLTNAPALARGDEIVLDPHVGDLASAAAAALLRSRARALAAACDGGPRLVVHDLHPDYAGTRLAGELAAEWGAASLAIAHHHAHALAIAAEHGLTEPFLAIVLDGTGLGPDGTTWGGELLHVDGLRCARLAHLETIALAGGDAAARSPWRSAAAWLARAFPHGDAPALPWHARRDAQALAVLTRAGASPRLARETSSCGRLFDAVASLLDLVDEASFEAEAPIALESLAARAPAGAAVPWPEEARATDTREAHPESPHVIPCADVMRRLVCAHARGESSALLARGFHETLAARLADRAIALAARHARPPVALAGGCLQNRLLLDALVARLERAGLRVLVAGCIPPSDAGLAVGQALAGRLALQERARSS